MIPKQISRSSATLQADCGAATSVAPVAEAGRMSAMSNRPVTAQDYLDSQVEIARLRLTDEERETLDGIISDFSEIADFNEERCHPVYANKARRRAAILRGLLERTGDCPTPDNVADRNNGTTGSV